MEAISYEFKIGLARELLYAKLSSIADIHVQQAVGGRPPQYAPPPVTFSFDLLTLKAVSESRVTWATSLPFWSS